jgi:IS1 family transposase
MNRLSIQRRAAIVGALVEGNSIRATSRMTGAARNTINALLLDLGAAAADYQDRALRNLDSTRIEADEIWSFVYGKDKNLPADLKGTADHGSVWTWVAIDAETKLIPSWLVGERNLPDAHAFIADLRSRLKNRIQLTTDGLQLYVTIVDSLFRDGIDYAVLHKLYAGGDDEHRYSPARVTGVEGRIICGDPDPDLVSTSYVERQNLTMRMGMRRFTRLTNGFSKRIEQHAAAVALHFMHYNYVRKHQTLKTTPAVAAGIEAHPWSLTQMIERLEEVEDRRMAA